MRNEKLEMSNLKFGVAMTQGNTTWPDLLDLWRELDRDANFDYLWLIDHFVPGAGDGDGRGRPASGGLDRTGGACPGDRRARDLGILVTGNTYRHPAVLAKMATSVDHISNGRLEFGLGAAWHDYEHEVVRHPLPHGRRAAWSGWMRPRI